MKSTMTYDMHNYAATTSPNICDGNKVQQRTVKRTEKYSLRQRQKRKNVLESVKNKSKSIQQKLQPDLNSSLICTTNDLSTSLDDLSTVTTHRLTTNSNGNNCNKTKTRAAPLSKYRRKTANARERTRMREINSAFENLRHCVPQAITGDNPNTTCEKLTKITTLRLAMKYIKLLTEALTQPNIDIDIDFLLQTKGYQLNEDNAQSPEAITSATTTITSNAKSDKCIKTSVTRKKVTSSIKSINSKNSITKTSATANSTRKAAVAKRKTKKFQQQQQQKQNKQQQQQQKQKQNHLQFHTYSASSCSSDITAFTITSNCDSLFAIDEDSVASIIGSTKPITSKTIIDGLTEANITTSTTTTTTTTAPITITAASLPTCKYVFLPETTVTIPLDQNPLILESDGESLVLSESCVSPYDDYDKLIEECHTDINENQLHYALSTSPTICGLSNPMELSLQMMETSMDDSLDFPNEQQMQLKQQQNEEQQQQQQPSTCFNALETFDSFNPFGDLLHTTDFQYSNNSLDLFLT